MEPALWIGPAIVAAIISGLINVVGWSVTFRHARRIERERRAEKIADVQSALLAEIRSDLQNLADIDVGEEISAIEKNLYSASEDQPYTPFVPKDSGAPIFSAIVREIAVLPAAVIDPVVLYYKQRDSVAHFTEDLRIDSFRQLPQDRKLAMMRDYLQLKGHAASLARDAVSALERSLGLPPTINSKVADPSAPRSASAPAEAAKDVERKSA